MLLSAKEDRKGEDIHDKTGAMSEGNEESEWKKRIRGRR